MIERFLGIHADYTKYLGYMLYGLAMHNNFTRTLEAGIGQGYISTVLTCAMYQNKGVHFAVEKNPELIRKLKYRIEEIRYGRALRVFTGESIKYAPPSSLDMIFLDSDHSYEYVTKELDHYTPLLRDYGYLFIHDYITCEGVKRACDKILVRKKWNKMLITDCKRKGKGCGTLICQRK